MTNTTKLLKWLFPEYIWEIKTIEKKIFLTFDDGPVPEVTDFVLEQLAKYNAKATFFCVGDNILKNKEIFKHLLKAGHSIGNHTHTHLKGWSTANEEYIQDFRRCSAAIAQVGDGQITKWFRPPYGRIKRAQAQSIIQTHQVMMWSVLTRDYDVSYDAEKCLTKAIQATQSGSIVLFHDSAKAKKNLYYVLPRYLQYWSQRGFSFEALV
jgi:peptidoglycan-N-acetylglucosamine deacetylase